jgi:hypothetical protein
MLRIKISTLTTARELTTDEMRKTVGGLGFDSPRDLLEKNSFNKKKKPVRKSHLFDS